ncbi:MAG: hypothetical protein ACRDNF_11270 [Streptosporangiaceae bacterium]
MSVGAGLGISGYRRATRVVRELTGPQSRGRPRLRLRQARGLAGFVRDVRVGMDLYTEQREHQRPGIEPPRHSEGPQRRAPEGPTLGWQHMNRAGASRNGASAR